MICLGELAVECTILVLGLAVLLAIIPVNALILLLEIKIAVFAALLLKFIEISYIVKCVISTRSNKHCSS